MNYARLDGRLSRLVTSRDMVGLAIAVVENGELRFVKGYGVTIAGSDDKVTANTVFRWASLSKWVASTMLAKLADEGRLSLNDPVSRFSTSLRLPRGNERVATVADVLSHRLGIVKNAYDDKLEQGMDPRAIRATFAGLTPLCAPGTCFAYQNVGYDTASEIVRSVTKQSYQDAVKQRLLTPLGMTSASLTREGLVSSRSWARPHVGQRALQVEEPYYRVPAAGGMNSSVLDLGTWLRAQMGENKGVLSTRVLENVHRARVSTAGTRRHGTTFDNELTDGEYALGWRDYRYMGHALVGHRGAVRGYRSMIAFDPRTHDGVAVLWNSESAKPVAFSWRCWTPSTGGRSRTGWNWTGRSNHPPGCAGASRKGPVVSPKWRRMTSKPRTLYEKIWDAHVVDRRDDGTCLIYIDRHLVHEVTSPQAFEALRLAGRKVRRPDLTLAVPDQ